MKPAVHSTITCGNFILETYPQQRGMALLAIVLLISFVGMAAFFTSADSTKYKLSRDKRTAEALSTAKAALLGRALTDVNRPGSLPCPDNDDSGSSAPFNINECPTYIGRLPWKSLGIEELVDGDGENLWYALSSTHRDNAAVEPLNSNTVGLLDIDGGADIVAIVFSPSSVLAGQVRPSNNSADYLETENSDGDTSFSRLISNVQNDKLISISRTELISGLSRKILGVIRGDTLEGMRCYYDSIGVYPFADLDGDGNADVLQLNGSPSFQGVFVNCTDVNGIYFSPATKNMLVNNGWFPMVNYQVAGDQQSATLVLNGFTLAVAP